MRRLVLKIFFSKVTAQGVFNVIAFCSVILPSTVVQEKIWIRLHACNLNMHINLTIRDISARVRLQTLEVCPVLVMKIRLGQMSPGRLDRYRRRFKTDRRVSNSVLHYLLLKFDVGWQSWGTSACRSRRHAPSPRCSTVLGGRSNCFTAPRRE